MARCVAGPRLIVYSSSMPNWLARKKARGGKARTGRMAVLFVERSLELELELELCISQFKLK